MNVKCPNQHIGWPMRYGIWMTLPLLSNIGVTNTRLRFYVGYRKQKVDYPASALLIQLNVCLEYTYSLCVCHQTSGLYYINCFQYRFFFLLVCLYLPSLRICQYIIPGICPLLSKFFKKGNTLNMMDSQNHKMTVVCNLSQCCFFHKFNFINFTSQLQIPLFSFPSPTSTNPSYYYPSSSLTRRRIPPQQVSPRQASFQGFRGCSTYENPST